MGEDEGVKLDTFIELNTLSFLIVFCQTLLPYIIHIRYKQEDYSSLLITEFESNIRLYGLILIKITQLLAQPREN